MTRVAGRPLLLLLLLVPGVARAQTPTPTPFPVQETAPTDPVEPPPTGEPATEDAQPPAEDSFALGTARPPRFEPPAIVPTIGIALAVNTSDRYPGVAAPSIPIWVGVSFLPSPNRFSPFTAVGVEVSQRTLVEGFPSANDHRSYYEFTPEMRMGVSWLRAPRDRYVNKMFPDVEVYGIGGWRIANQYQGHAARLGVGVSSPMLMALMTAVCQTPVPAMVEVTMDVDSFKGSRDYSLRFGWHF